MKKSRGRNVLVATLGLSAAVISETANKLEAEGTTLDRIIVVHTDDERVWEKQTAHGVGIGLSDLIQYYASKKGVPGFVETVSLAMDDILSLEDNRAMLKILVKTIDRYQQEGYQVHVAIAGGRKTMSAMAQFAACLMGCSGLYHVLLTGNAKILTEQYGFELGTEFITLVNIPVIDYSLILANQLCETDRSVERKDLSAFLQKADYDVGALVSKINESLASEHSWKHLKSVYEKKQNLYQSFTELLSALLRAAISGVKPHPIIEARIKEFGSLYDKYQKWLHDPSRKIKDITDITDLAGLRIICYSLGDMEKVKEIICCLSETKQLKIIKHPGKQSDKFGGVAVNKDFGYVAYHYDVSFCGERLKLSEYRNMKGLRAEIQITTIMHHGWAKLEHGLRYKSEEYDKMADSEKAQISLYFQTAMMSLNDSLNYIDSIQSLYGENTQGKAQARDGELSPQE